MFDIEEHFSDSIIEHVNVWLNVYDTDLNIIVWNPMAEKISGYSREDVIGHNKVWGWLYPDDTYRDKLFVIANNMVTTEEFLFDEETQITCKDGQQKTIAWNSRSLFDSQGNVYAVITFGYDVTMRKKAEDALKKAHNELSVLYDIASIAGESIDLNKILDNSLDRVLPAMKSKKGMIHLWNTKTQALSLASHRGLPHSALAELALKSLDDGLISQVFSQREPVMVFDMGARLKISNTPAKLFHTYLGVPMRAKGNVVGVISVFGKASYHYSPEEITLLASIADQIGVAVENASLYQEAGQLAVMEERQRLARDLHDSVTQSLFSLTLFAEAGQRLLRNGNLKDAETHLAWLGETAQDALKEMRLLVYELQPAGLNPGGLVDAIQQRLNTVERRAGIKAHLIAENFNVELPLPIEEGLYRIIQEALNNSLKHASGASVTVKLLVTDTEISAVVSDNGTGFDIDEACRNGGMGLINMKERAWKMDGHLQIISSFSEGTQVTVSIKKENRQASEVQA